MLRMKTVVPPGPSSCKPEVDGTSLFATSKPPTFKFKPCFSTEMADHTTTSKTVVNTLRLRHDWIIQQFRLSDFDKDIVGLNLAFGEGDVGLTSTVRLKPRAHPNSHQVGAINARAGNSFSFGGCGGYDVGLQSVQRKDVVDMCLDVSLEIMSHRGMEKVYLERLSLRNCDGIALAEHHTLLPRQLSLDSNAPVAVQLDLGVSLKKLLEALPDHHLTVRCELMVDLGRAFRQSKRTPRKGSDEVTADLARMRQHPASSDVVIKVSGGKEILAHRAILAARSEYFRALFRFDEKEKEVTLSDVTEEQAQVLLDYIYTGAVDCSPSSALDLLVLADTYLFTNLRKEAEVTAAVAITTKNVTDCLTLAERHNASHLFEAAVNFIKSEKSVLRSAEWGQLLKTKPELTSKVMQELLV